MLAFDEQSVFPFDGVFEVVETGRGGGEQQLFVHSHHHLQQLCVLVGCGVVQSPRDG